MSAAFLAGRQKGTQFFGRPSETKNIKTSRTWKFYRTCTVPATSPPRHPSGVPRISPRGPSYELFVQMYFLEIWSTLSSDLVFLLALLRANSARFAEILGEIQGLVLDSISTGGWMQLGFPAQPEPTLDLPWSLFLEPSNLFLPCGFSSWKLRTVGT